MYKLKRNPITQRINYVNFVANNITMCIPISSDNTDYANFKAQIMADEAELQDADGNVMSAEEAKAYIATLPA